MCCACGGGESWTSGTLPSDVEHRCHDLSSEHLDSQSESCAAYNTSRCDRYDTSNFNSSELCCACGGGENVLYVDAMTESLNSEGYSCLDISRLLTRGFDEICTSSYDTTEFTASDMCLACGGGVEVSTNMWYDVAETCDDSMYDGRTNKYGDSCSDYETNPSSCTYSWRSDSDFTATRDSNNKWVEGWLSQKYEDCPENIRKLIEYHHKNGLMLEYRRRGFEIDGE